MQLLLRFKASSQKKKVKHVAIFTGDNFFFFQHEIFKKIKFVQTKLSVNILEQRWSRRMNILNIRRIRFHDCLQCWSLVCICSEFKQFLVRIPMKLLAFQQHKSKTIVETIQTYCSYSGDDPLHDSTVWRTTELRPHLFLLSSCREWLPAMIRITRLVEKSHTSWDFKASTSELPTLSEMNKSWTYYAVELNDTEQSRSKRY